LESFSAFCKEFSPSGPVIATIRRIPLAIASSVVITNEPMCETLRK